MVPETMALLNHQQTRSKTILSQMVSRIETITVTIQASKAALPILSLTAAPVR